MVYIIHSKLELIQTMNMDDFASNMWRMFILLLSHLWWLHADTRWINGCHLLSHHWAKLVVLCDHDLDCALDTGSDHLRTVITFDTFLAFREMYIPFPCWFLYNNIDMLWTMDYSINYWGDVIEHCYWCTLAQSSWMYVLKAKLSWFFFWMCSCVVILDRLNPTTLLSNIL